MGSIRGDPHGGRRGKHSGHHYQGVPGEPSKLLPQAEHAALAQDARALAAITHQWKGSLGLLGARRAQSSAARLEELCRLGEPERLSESFSVLRRELLELSNALESATPIATGKADSRTP